VTNTSYHGPSILYAQYKNIRKTLNGGRTASLVKHAPRKTMQWRSVRHWHCRTRKSMVERAVQLWIPTSPPSGIFGNKVNP